MKKSIRIIALLMATLLVCLYSCDSQNQPPIGTGGDDKPPENNEGEGDDNTEEAEFVYDYERLFPRIAEPVTVHTGWFRELTFYFSSYTAIARALDYGTERSELVWEWIDHANSLKWPYDSPQFEKFLKGFETGELRLICPYLDGLPFSTFNGPHILSPVQGRRYYNWTVVGYPGKGRDFRGKIFIGYPQLSEYEWLDKDTDILELNSEIGMDRDGNKDYIEKVEEVTLADGRTVTVAFLKGGVRLGDEDRIVVRFMIDGIFVSIEAEEKYLTAEFWSRLSVGEFKVPEFPDEAE